MKSALLDDEYHMRRALRLALRAAADGEIPVGALIVCGQRTLGQAANGTERLHDVTAHAEMLALTAATQTLQAKYLPDATLYVTLEPCPMCAAALRAAHIGRIVWAADDPDDGATRYQPTLFHKRTTITRGLLANEATTLLRNFFKHKR